MCDLLCYHCCYKIENKILHMPIDYKNGEYICEGNFCCIPCMKTYNLELNDSYMNVRFMHINSLSMKLYNKVNNTFAPRKEQFNHFGGNITYNDVSKLCSAKISLKEVPPMVILNKSLNTNQCVVDQTHNIDVNSDIALPRLERKKPLKNNQNTLEKTMGIFKSS